MGLCVSRHCKLHIYIRESPARKRAGLSYYILTEPRRAFYDQSAFTSPVISWTASQLYRCRICGGWCRSWSILLILQCPIKRAAVFSKMAARKKGGRNYFTHTVKALIYKIKPPLLAQNSQKVSAAALRTVVAAQTLPVSVPSCPICFAITYAEGVVMLPSITSSATNF